jgi:CRP/FNR family transcriptional regulator, cyclic AMP receptor protein
VEIMSSSQPVCGTLGVDFLRDLQAIKPAQRFRPGAALFHRGSPGTGVYLVEAGEVQVILEGGKGEKQLLEVAGPGAILGLSEIMAAVKYRVTAIAGEETKAVFIPREEFLAFLHDHCDYCLQVVSVLSDNRHELYHKFGSISAHPGRPRRRSLDEQLN